MAIFFTADLHLHHVNIMKYCNRPFKSVEEMDATLIGNWNRTVTKSDTVYFLGDMLWVRKGEYNNQIKQELYALRKALNGSIIWVPGNHDKKICKELARAANSFGFQVAPALHTTTIDGTGVTLCHFALRTWNGSHYGSYHFYGHSHGTLPEIETSRSCDVGVDVKEWNFTPVRWDALVAKMKTRAFKPVEARSAEEKVGCN